MAFIATICLFMFVVQFVTQGERLHLNFLVSMGNDCLFI